MLYFRFDLIHFGLMNRPAKTQRMMNKDLEGLLLAKVYIYDVVMFQILRTLDKHILDDKTVLERISQCILKIKFSKCYFFARMNQATNTHLRNHGRTRKMRGIELAPRPTSKT